MAEAYSHIVAKALDLDAKTEMETRYMSAPTNVTYPQLEEAAKQIDAHMQQAKLTWSVYEAKHMPRKQRKSKKRCLEESEDVD